MINPNNANSVYSEHPVVKPIELIIHMFDNLHVYVSREDWKAAIESARMMDFIKVTDIYGFKYELNTKYIIAVQDKCKQ